MKLSEKIKIAVLAYWKFKRHHMMGAIECKNADVFTVTRTYMTTDTEVKVSISDMQREARTKYYKHRRFIENNPERWAQPFTHYFYFAVPIDLQDKALDVIKGRYPYAGLLVFTDGEIDIYKPLNIKMVKRSSRFKRDAVGLKELMELGYQATNTALRYGNRLMKNEM